MQEIFDKMIEKAGELLEKGTVDRVLGWKAGEFFYDPTPAVFGSKQELSDLVYSGFCGANLSKYLINETKKDGKIAVFLKPCDTYSFNELLKEHRIDREKTYVIGIFCDGKLDIEKIRAMGIKGITSVDETNDTLTVHTLYGDRQIPRRDALLDRCTVCRKKHVVFDEMITVDRQTDDSWKGDRFDTVASLEAMTPDERFEFWRGELSKCIRCNACRNVCPACSCTNCVFDNPDSGISQKAAVDSFEENMFHIIRAFHVAGRCTDCGECSRVCPQNIPLHLLIRKFIKDIDSFYGEFQAGETADEPRTPLTNFTKEDVEPTVVSDKGGDN